jgi:hypothetical protein
VQEYLIKGDGPSAILFGQGPPKLKGITVISIGKEPDLLAI